MWTPLGPEESVLIREVWGEIIHVCIVLGPNKVSSITSGVLISGCPHLGVPLYEHNLNGSKSGKTD